MNQSKFHFLGERRILDDSIRATLPGHFIELSNGIVNYELIGPSEAQTIVLVHGFSVPLFVWDYTYDELIKAGFRVLRYDLFGRGYSDRPNCKYNLYLFVKQLYDLLSILQIKTPIDLIGLSMGGPITIGFVDAHPELVRKLILISPAGTMKGNLQIKLLETPIIGEILANFLIGGILKPFLKADFYKIDDRNLSEYVNKYNQQMSFEGFKYSLISSIRAGLLTKMRDVYERVGKKNIPIALIWGKKDRTVPYELNKDVRELIPHVEFYPIDDAAHNSHYEKPETINQLIVDFLLKNH